MCLREGSGAGVKGVKTEVFIYPLKRLLETRDKNQSELVVAVGILYSAMKHLGRGGVGWCI